MHSYLGIRIKQRTDSEISFIMLAAPASEIHAWSQADDIRLDRGNVQRSLVDSRWRQVRKFYRSHTDNVIPTSVTVAFSNSLPQRSSLADLNEADPGYFIEDLGKDNLVRITFPTTVRDNSYIIDGQHRIKGMSELDFPIVVPVCLFPSLTQLERAFQFVTINNKSHKVPTDNLKALISNFSDIETDLRQRLSAATITVPKLAVHVDLMNEDPESPFHKMVSWVNNRYPDGKHIIAPAGIENGIKAIQAGFRETRDDDADAIVVMSTIWRSIFNYYGVTLDNIEEFKNLTKKAVIQTVTEMVVDQLVRRLDPAFFSGAVASENAAEAGNVASQLVSSIPAEFWQQDWVLKSLDTSAGRRIIADSIRLLKRGLSKHAGDDAYEWRIGNPLTDRTLNGLSSGTYNEEEGAE